jgi:hypothetical protein
MVHRDFKPANVLLGPDGPVVIDFGLATVPGMTTTGLAGQAAIGTPAFMAPEQLAAERVTSAADMWSWGVTIAFAGTGELPFRGDSLTATAFAILNSDPKVGKLPEPLGALVHRCLRKDPSQRPTAREALNELVAAGARLVGPIPPMAFANTEDDTAGSSDRAVGASTAPQPDRGQGPTGGGLASRLRAGKRRSSRGRWRWRAAAITTLILLVAGAGGLALTLLGRGAKSEGPPRGGSNRQLNAEAAARGRAVNWILHQVSGATVVSCDYRVCAELVSAGFPSGNLMPIGNMSNGPVGSDLLLATADIRDKFGRRLASVYAPAVIASFGSGSARIDIRLVFPSGTKSYRAIQQAALNSRKAADAQLLNNSNITLSAVARAQLRSGAVDPLLPLLIVSMAAGHPLRIVDFSSQSPGGGPASLLRWVDVATSFRGAHLTPAAYVSWMRAFADGQRTPFRPAWVRQIKLPDGQSVLRIGYGAPSPLRLPASG